MKLCCICPTVLGSEICEIVKGIEEVYYSCSSNINGVIYNPILDKEDELPVPDDADEYLQIVCSGGEEISEFSVVDNLLGNGFYKINFVNTSDDGEVDGAVLTHDNTFTGEAGVKYNYVLTLKMNLDDPNHNYFTHNMLGREALVLLKYRTEIYSRWVALNHEGGMKFRQITGSSNLTYDTVTFSGNPYGVPVPISYNDDGAWADANLIPVEFGGYLVTQ